MNNLKLKKKAQLEVMQSAFALMFVFFILVIAAIFIIVQQRNNTKDKLDQFLVLSQIKKSMSVSLLPEVQYSADSVSVTDNYDRFSLFAFKKLIDANPDQYKQMFSNVKLRLDEYEFSSGWSEVTIFDYSPKKYSSKKEFKIPVALTNQQDYKKTIGVLYLELYQ